MCNTSKGAISKWEDQIERGNLCICKLCTHSIQKRSDKPLFFTESPFLPTSFFMKNLNSPPPFLLLFCYFPLFETLSPLLNKGRGFSLCRHILIVFIVNFEHIQSNIQNVKCSCWNF